MIIAACLGAAVFLQALLLGVPTEMGIGGSIQYYAGAAGLAALTVVLWRYRALLNPHADMFLIMLAAGGLGMFAIPGHLACTVGSWSAYGWMLLFGLGPAIPLARCLQTALRHGYLLRAILIDAVTMIAGMWLASRITGGHVLLQHLRMLGGMSIGMMLGMWIRSAMLESRSRSEAFQGNCRAEVPSGL